MSWILSIVLMFSKDPNGYLLIFLWLLGSIFAFIGKGMKESGWLITLAMWLNIISVTVYVLWVFIIGLIWSRP
ncbi:hypothetical protein [Melghiribacillus thermohalophilus]|uniref:hypothetical protein n=1 Tax=Melghiribacillus thermohalophilus TaxID=1324956 RepID=UPI001043C22F|nr:hypothetical protein [Melghiribacillus thermohalophilus]